MKQIMVLLHATGIGSALQAENRTDTSFFMKSDSNVYQKVLRSKSGELYLTIGRHGPAVENECVGVRESGLHLLLERIQFPVMFQMTELRFLF